MLFDPLRHDALTLTPWDATAARASIEQILADSLKQYSPSEFWPSHPQDDKGPPAVLHSLYVGAAGVIWALDYFEKLGLARALPDFSQVFEALFAANHDGIRNSASGTNGLLIADCGILLLGARLGSPAHMAEQMAGAIDANQANPALELMWGSPGTMLAALLMHEWTGDSAWTDRFRRDAEALWAAMEYFEGADCFLWRQQLYGSSLLMLGGVHGFAGNALALIRGWNLLSVSAQQQWAQRIEHTLRATAEQQSGLMNWPPFVGTRGADQSEILVQHCHGAPGMVNCLARLPDTRIDDLLSMAAELIWVAGPLLKGANLCHGTAGNGYAFLKLFQRTKDEKWLYRARRFAMHAIEQHQRDRIKYGQLRYSLWTGDLGLAVYLWHCIQSTSDFPVLEVF